jgi:hypothetical protein
MEDYRTRQEGHKQSTRDGFENSTEWIETQLAVRATTEASFVQNPRR